MAKFITYLSPIRFRPYATISGGIIDDDMPRVDKMANQTQYYKGVYPLENYTADWKLNEEIEIQMQSNDAAIVDQDIILTTPSGNIIINAEDMTPVGWVGNNIYKYKYIPTEIGDYYFTTYYSSGVNWISDVFRVHPNEMNLVEFQYSDTENRHRGVFWIPATEGQPAQLRWNPKIYFTGIQDVGEPRNEYSLYTDESGEPRKIQADPQNTIQVELTDLTRRHIDQLNTIFSCDTISVNGQPVQNTENIKIDFIPKSDAMNVSINLVQIDNDGFVKNY